MAALDNRPRPGRELTITAEATACRCRWPPQGEVAWQNNRKRLLREQLHRVDRRNGRVPAGSTCQVAGFGCQVTAGARRQNQRGIVAQHANSPVRPAGQRNLGRLSLPVALDDRPMEQLTYDPELDMLFYGSSGVGAASEALPNMPGAASGWYRYALRCHTKDRPDRVEASGAANEIASTFEMTLARACD
jgi:hypothetical protein